MPRQQPLFDDLSDDPAAPAPAPAVGTALIQVTGPAAKLSKAQREFNRLSQRIGRLRDHLARWRVAQDAVQQRAVTELVPLNTQLTALQRETVLWIDGYLASPPPGERLPKKLRVKLVSMLRLLAGAVLEDGPDDAVEAAHDRHSVRSHSDDQREQADLAASLLGQAMGDPALFEGEAASVDELMQRASQRLQEQQDETQADSPGALPPGHRPSRAEKARARDAQKLKEASQSVREIYRRLASSLHPDREPDAAERARKTALMARVNEAYARNDLLALLTVQLDIEQISADHLAGVSDERLRHYSRVLKDQQQALEGELAELQMPVCQHMQADPGLLTWPPELLAQALTNDLHQMRDALHHLSRDSQALRDPRTRLAFLRQVEVEDPDDELDPFEELLLLQALDGALDDALGDAPAKAARPPKRKRR